MVHGWEWGVPMMGLMWLVPLLFLVVLLLALARCLGFWPGALDRGPQTETPKEILDRRYAKGEIDKEKYEEMKRDLNR